VSSGERVKGYKTVLLGVLVRASRFSFSGAERERRCRITTIIWKSTVLRNFESASF